MRHTAHLILPLGHVFVLEANAVCLQVGLCREGPVAHRTIVGYITGVTPRVFLKRRLVVERLVTHGALDALALGVDEGVAAQMLLAPVGLAAHGAGVGLEAGVDLAVGAQGVGGGEELVAEVAGELSAHMGFGMFDEIFALSEGLGAGVTLKPLLIVWN